MDIQLILEFKNSFGKYHPVFPKNPKSAFLWDTLYVHQNALKVQQVFHQTKFL